MALLWARRGACGLRVCTREAWWGEAKRCFIGGVGGGEVSPGVSGGGSVSVVVDGSVVGLVAGDEYGKAHVGCVEGGSHVSAVLADGSVDVVSGGSRVGLVEGAGSEGVAVVGVVGVDSRVGVLGEYARVGFAVGADSVSDSADAARLLDVRLRRESGGGDGGGGLRVSEGVRRSLYSGEGVSVALSVVARDGSSVVLGDGVVRWVLCGRPVASEWSVDSVLGSCQLPRRLVVAAWTWALLPRLSPVGRLSRVPHPSWVVDCTLTLGLSKVLYCSVAYVQCRVVVGVVAVPAC